MRQEMEPGEQGQIGRKLLRSMDCGVLSTMSSEMPGFPFGSITPYVMTHEGNVVIYVSGIAQHTKNMLKDDKVCLTVMDDGGGNKQDQGRATIVGHARRVPDDCVETVSERYYSFFPEARAYGGAHDFQFIWIEAVRVRYIGGFGKIFWIENDEWNQSAPEWAGGEAGIVEHMNDDHSASVVAMAKHFFSVEDEAAVLLAADAEGCHLRAGGGIHYLPFDERAHDRDSVREAMVALAHACRG